MPIAVKDFIWEENETHVFVTVPLKGVQGKKADIYSSDSFIKVNFPPYLFEVDLHSLIDEQSSSAVIGNGCVNFKLVKQVPGLWSQLSSNLEKEAVHARRSESQARSRQKQEQLLEEKSKQEQLLAREAVKRQMELEADERQKIEHVKETEKKTARDDIERLNSKAAQLSSTRPPTNATLDSQISAPVRSKGTINVSFTPRAFPTPIRESHQEEEEKWLEKQAAARKAVKEAKDSAPGSIENDPVWLKDKGNTFFQHGDWQSAINAYTAALTLDPNMAAAYGNRAACHLKLNDPQACIADCSKALVLLQPPVPSTAGLRLKLHCRRGAALAAIEDYENAIVEYREALLLDPHNEQLVQDMKALTMKHAP